MNDIEYEITKIFEELPFNTYQDLFNAIRNKKANIKFMRSDCSQIAQIKHPYFGGLGILTGFLVTMFLIIVYSVYFSFYWSLLLIPINFVLTYTLNFFPILKKIAWIVLIIDLIFIKLNTFFLVLSLDIILMYFFYNVWWSIICANAISELELNPEAFLWSWNRCGIAIEDSYGNTYYKNKI